VVGPRKPEADVPAPDSGGVDGGDVCSPAKKNIISYHYSTLFSPSIQCQIQNDIPENAAFLLATLM
jgi:hypothetical protein